MIYSKVLDLDDYNNITEHMHINNMIGMLKNTRYRFEHKHRGWEYGISLNALRANNTKTVLDVGGGGSVFAPACAWLNIDITQVDPGDCSSWVDEQNKHLGMNIKYIQKDFFDYDSYDTFDAVTCISVIEHVPDHVKFFKKLLKHVNKSGLLILTTDFHPSGERKTPGHLRTYNGSGLYTYNSIAKGFDWFGGEYDYTYKGDDVHNYTFASLTLKKDEKE